MKKKLFICLSFFLTWNYCKAQYVFQRNYLDSGYYASTSFDITSDGGFIMVGMVKGSGDIYMFKTDSSGTVEWMKIYSDSSNKIVKSIQHTFDGGYILTGSSNFPSSLQKLFLIKTDSYGDTLWTRKYGTSSEDYRGEIIRQTSDSGYLIASGVFDGLFTGGLMIRTDSAGNVLWSKGTGEIASFCQADDGAIIFVRNLFFYGKADSAGNSLWMKRLWDPNNLCYSVGACAITNEGGYIFAGSYNNSNLGLHGCYLAKTNSAGDTLWTKCYPVSSIAVIASVQQITDGGYIAGGYSGTKAFAMKTDSTGSIIWQKVYNVTGGIANICQLLDGGIIIKGNIAPPINKTFLIKTDGNGNSWCNDSIINQVPFVPYGEILANTGTWQPVPLVNYNSNTIAVSSATPPDTIICISQVGISEQLLNKIIIYPNPFTNILSIELEKQNIKQVSYTVKNILGQIIFKLEENNSGNNSIKKFDLNFLSNGIYLLEVIIDEERTIKKIVKE